MVQMRERAHRRCRCEAIDVHERRVSLTAPDQTTKVECVPQRSLGPSIHGAVAN